MSDARNEESLEKQLDQWRTYLRRRQAIQAVDVAELEDHLREQVAGLVDAGLSTDEAFLVAVKRMGDLDSLSREFAREHSERLWKQLVVLPDHSAEPIMRSRQDAMAAVLLTVAAAVAVKLPTIFGLTLDGDEGFYARNASLFVLPLLALYFAWKRGLDGPVDKGTLIRLFAAFFVAGVVANVYPFVPRGSTEVLTALHVPIALWLIVGMAYAGSRWGQVDGRMDFIRFSGELFIYYVLIALGGGVLTGFLMMMFQAIQVDAEPFIESWLIPCGAAGAVLVASWLVEAKQNVIENMAPVLTRLFTPLFAAVLFTFLCALVLTGRGVGIERNVLLGFDLLLVVVLGLLLYSISARDPRSPPGIFDVLQVVLLSGALLVDVVALWAVAARITEFGFSPNRVAVLGMNVILLVNLSWSAALYVRFLRGSAAFSALERWQTSYLYVYAVWAALVAILFPVVFGYS
jgi:hypothetical protein